MDVGDSCDHLASARYSSGWRLLIRSRERERGTTSFRNSFAGGRRGSSVERHLFRNETDESWKALNFESMSSPWDALNLRPACASLFHLSKRNVVRAFAEKFAQICVPGFQEDGRHIALIFLLFFFFLFLLDESVMENNGD